jgi:3',5'-cyclic AMP phosphodiesterase CpdA
MILKLLNKLRLLLLLAVITSLMPLPVATQTRIAVVSDIHVMAPSLLPSGSESKDAWTTYYTGQRKMLDKSAAIFDQFVNTITSTSPKPDLLLITGDLTKDGEQASHDYVKTKLAELESAGIQCYVIPGNHDFGEEGNHTQFNADGTTSDADVLSTSDFATFYADYGYIGSTVDTNGSLSYVAEPVSGLILLAIDSHSASISDSTLKWLCAQASQARANGKQVIAMMHHPLFPHITGADMFIDTYAIGNHDTVRNKLINAGVNVIMTGHFHTSDIAKDWNDDASKAIYDINTGSLISYPCDYRMLTLSADKTTLSVSTSSLTPTGMTAAECKTWLSDRTKSIATTKMNNKAGGLASVFADKINNIATFAAKLFILHAEGNENSSADRAGIETEYTYMANAVYAAIFIYGGISDASVYSILDDKSNYDKAHEDQTNDRMLSITLSGSTVLDEVVTIPASGNGWATYCTGHDVDISLTDGLTAYTVTALSPSTATLTQVTKIPAEEGFMLKGAGGDYTLKPAATDVSAITNLLIGTLVTTPAIGGNYALATKSDITAFYPVKEGINIPAHKAYIANIPSGARLIAFEGDGGTTDIRFIEKGLDHDADQPIYNLQGMRTTSLRPGIYIQNGRKIVIK